MAWEALIDIIPYNIFADERKELLTLSKSISKQALLYVSFDAASGSAVPVVGNPASGDKARQSLMEHAFVLYDFPALAQSNDRAIIDLKYGRLGAKFSFEPRVEADLCRIHAPYAYVHVHFQDEDHIVFKWLISAFTAARIVDPERKTHLWTVFLAAASAGVSNADTLCITIDNSTDIPSGTAFLDFSPESGLWKNKLLQTSGLATALSGTFIRFHSSDNAFAKYVDSQKPPILSPYTLGACNDPNGLCLPAVGPLPERARAVPFSSNVRRANFSGSPFQRGIRPWSADRLMLNMFESYPTSMADKITALQDAQVNSSVFSKVGSHLKPVSDLRARDNSKNLYLTSRQLLHRHSLGYAMAAPEKSAGAQTMLIAWNAESDDHRLSIPRGLAALFCILLFVRRVYTIDRFGAVQTAFVAKYFSKLRISPTLAGKLSKANIVVDIMQCWVLLAAFIEICVSGEFLGPGDIDRLPVEFVAFQYALLFGTVFCAIVLYISKLWHAAGGNLVRMLELWLYWSVKYTAWQFVLTGANIVLLRFFSVDLEAKLQNITKTSLENGYERLESRAATQAPIWQSQLSSFIGVALVTQTLAVLFHFNPSNLFSRAALVFVYGIFSLYFFYNALVSWSAIYVGVTSELAGMVVYTITITALSVANYVLYNRDLLIPFLYTLSYGAYETYMVTDAVMAAVFSALGLFLHDVLSSSRSVAKTVLQAQTGADKSKKNS